MRYYVISDVHGYYTQMKSALEKAGFFSDTTPHKLIMLGDLFDRGHEAKQLQQFILEQMEQDKIILIRGNHEDLFVELVTTDAGMPYSYHKSNGTYDTALQLTGFDPVMASIRHYDFADAAKDTPFYKEIIPAMLDYFETEHYVFTHGWIPSIPNRDKSYGYISSWREADREQWNQARWFNGMDAAQTADENKTIVCGHWHTSYGHSKYEHKGDRVWRRCGLLSLLWSRNYCHRCLYSVQWKGKLSCDRGLTAWRSTGLNFAYPFITTL